MTRSAIVLILAFFRNVSLIFYVAQIADVTLHYRQVEADIAVTNPYRTVLALLTHYGSHVPLSTLTLNITTSEPRLGTGCWLDFTRQALLLYDISLNL